MTVRDANAHPMSNYFDFRKAAFDKPRRRPRPWRPGPAKCAQAGRTAPLQGVTYPL